MDKAVVKSFRERGAVVLRDVFKEWIEPLRNGVAKNMEAPGPDVRIYKGGDTIDGDGQFFGDYCNWQRIPEYGDFIFNSSIGEMALQLMGSKTTRLFHEHVLVKEAKTDVVTPWHQDEPYYCVDAPQNVSVWIPLDDVPRERSPEFVAGSHNWGRCFQPERFNGQPLNENDDLEKMPDINADRSNYDLLGWALSIGDAVAFNFRTVHGAPANISPSSSRRAFSLRLVGDGALFSRVPGRVSSPPFNDVELKDGAPLVGDQFPELYRA